MIAGIQITQIKSTDYYRRFLILQKILAQKQHFITHTHNTRNPHQYVFAKYNNLLKELALLENHIHIENHQYYSREKETHFTLQQMEKEYQRCFQSADPTVTHYEKKIMQAWRDGITKNEEKEKIGRNEWESRGSNNKNLMLLTSELLKKERQTKNIIQNEYRKIIDETNNARKQFLSKKQVLDQQITKMKQQKQKLQTKVSAQLERRETSAQKQLHSLQSEIKRCRNTLSHQKEQSEVRVREIEGLLQELQPKYM